MIRNNASTMCINFPSRHLPYLSIKIAWILAFVLERDFVKSPVNIEKGILQI